jgi:hypothetical protein
VAPFPDLCSAAREDFAYVLARNPQHLDALNNKAQSEMSQGMLQEAQDTFFLLLKDGRRVGVLVGVWRVCVCMCVCGAQCAVRYVVGVCICV